MSKTIDTIVGDIYGILVNGGHIPDPANLQKYLDITRDTILRYMKEGSRRDEGEPSFRLSKIGMGERKAWFEWNTPASAVREQDVFKNGPNQFRFLMGSLIEPLLLFFATEAGHIITREQEDVELAGVPGHPDCVIDGVLADVKTASPYGFDKFSEGKIFQQDDWGYLWQLSAYKEAMGLPKDQSAYFLAFNKSSCEMVLLEVPPHLLPDATKKIRRLQEVVKFASPPVDKCWPTETEKNGNEILPDNCRFCPFRDKCWKDTNNGAGLRKFKYARRVEFLTKVVKTPNVEELMS